VFWTERKATFTRDGVLKMFKRAGEAAAAHAAAFKAANDGVAMRTVQHLLGHKNCSFF
jgi:site-specific recombinase XerD